MFKVPLSFLIWIVSELVFMEKTSTNPLLYILPFEMLIISIYFYQLWIQEKRSLPMLLSLIYSLYLGNLCFKISSVTQFNTAFFIAGMSFNFVNQQEFSKKCKIALLITTIIIFHLTHKTQEIVWNINNTMPLEAFLAVLVIQMLLYKEEETQSNQTLVVGTRKDQSLVQRRRVATENLLNLADGNISLKDQQKLYSQRILPSKQVKTMSEIQESTTLFNVLLNSIPDGVIVLEGLDKVCFINKCLRRMFPNLDNLEILKQLFQATNCSEDLEEQKMVEKMFDNLNTKLMKHNYDDSIKEDFDPLSNMNQASALTIKLECEIIMKQLNRHIQQSYSSKWDNTQLAGKQKKQYNFIGQTTMLCIIPKRDQIRDNDEQSVYSTLPRDFKNTYLQIIFKPFLKAQQAHILMVVRDVSMFNQIKVLRNINQNKSRMLYHVSHEFRTPLNCIILMTQAMSSQLDQKMNDKFANPILSSATQLLNLSNDLLDIAQLKAGKFHLNLSEFNINTMLHQIKDLMSIQMSLKGIELIIDCKEEPLIIKSDENRVRQVILNLVGNAFKFTQHGSIIILVQREEGNQVSVSVVDTGVGIDQIYQKKLFTEFGKLDSEASVNVQGVGLGLVISNILSRKLSENSQTGCKSILVNSEGRGHGSTFRFYIFDHRITEYQRKLRSSKILSPKSKQQHQQQDTKQEISMHKALLDKPKQIVLESYRSIDLQFENQLHFSYCSCPEILIVDDVPFNLLAVKESLIKYSLKIKTANSGLEALNMVREYDRKNSQCECSNYRIILMDIEMPEMDGFETAREIRNYTKLPIKIYACTGHQASQIRERVVQSGMDGCITKPINSQRIIDLINSLKEFTV